MLTTANPLADAERYGNLQAQHEAETDYEAQKLADQEAQSLAFFEQVFACNAKSWFTDPVRVFTNPDATLAPDDLLSDLVSRDRSRDCIEIRRLFAQLITGPHAAELRKEAARLLSKEYPEAGELNG